jgi:hypothetical protein
MGEIINLIFWCIFGSMFLSFFYVIYLEMKNKDD